MAEPAPGGRARTPSRFNINDVLRPDVGRRLGRLPRLVRRAVGLTWQAAPRAFATVSALQLLGGLGVAGQVVVAEAVLQRLLADGADPRLGDVIGLLALLALTSALVSFAGVARVEGNRLLTELVGRHATRQVIATAAAVDLEAYDDAEFHNRLERARVNAVVRPVQMASGVVGMVAAVFGILGIALAVASIQPWILGLVFLAYAPVWFAARRASRLGYDFTVAQTEDDRRRGYLLMLLSGRESASEVRSFQLADHLTAQHDALYDARITRTRRLVRRRLQLSGAGALLTAALTTGAVGVLVAMVAADRLTLADAGAAAAAVLLLGQRLQLLGSSAGSLFESSLFLEDFTTFVVDAGAARTGGAPPPGAARSTGTPSADLSGFAEIRLEDVGFTYPTASRPAIEGVSMTIGRGQVVALVGENGSGKTTVAKLLAGLYAPHEGRITWDGVPTTALDPDAVRRACTVLYQDFVRYHLSVVENVGYGQVERIDDVARLQRAVRDAGAEHLVAGFDEGWDTLLGAEYFGGHELSGGEWQRIALARGFFRDAPLLILDEPTASMDPRAEYRLFERVRELQAGRTVVLVSHRFANVRDADRIYVMHEGRVAEAGSHAELIAAGGLYAELYGLQAKAYLEDA